MLKLRSRRISGPWPYRKPTLVNSITRASVSESAGAIIAAEPLDGRAYGVTWASLRKLNRARTRVGHELGRPCNGGDRLPALRHALSGAARDPGGRRARGAMR